ncbi:hypothetical protein EVAR_22401_1 [Eumeta japonica]|uniref:Uncharacterized protein n=1 Tax=Eumeta variegata TaxID=151549 RepID=A0A4C1VK26_EUMVA|nr:hypothetical protein EVAR_22401_1 [Eumeta japonica]
MKASQWRKIGARRKRRKGRERNTCAISSKPDVVWHLALRTCRGYSVSDWSYSRGGVRQPGLSLRVPYHTYPRAYDLHVK